MGAPALAPQRAPEPRRAPSRRSPARSAPSRRAPARSAAKPRAKNRAARPAHHPRGFAQPALAGAALIPHAAVRTAGAVRDLSDSNLIVRLTRGRGWIAVLCVLLAGIVALNVISLSINSTSGRVSQRISDLERSNSALRGSLAEELSASRVERAAADLGLATPPGDEVTYLDASDGDLMKLLALLETDTVLTAEPAASSTAAGSDSAALTAPTASGVPASPPAAGPAPSAPAQTPAPAAPAPSGGTTGGVGL